VPEPARSAFEELLEEYASFRREHSGVCEFTIHTESTYVGAFLSALKRRRRELSRLRLSDVDRFVEAMSTRLSRKSISGRCTALRCFFRFLHATGRLPADLSASILAPRLRAFEKPPRHLPWADVQRIVRVVDRDTRVGRRDFALLLLMASYGLRAGEVVRLRIEDIDWTAGILRVVHWKTRTQTQLPLSPAVAEAVAAYLRSGRPEGVAAREIFLRARAPYCRLGGATAICNLLKRRAADASVAASYLGSHVLRHSHATRQVAGGAAA
jgi:site-specific recombinase XerD